MQISELAKQLGVTSDLILKTLKALKLKSKDSKQELSSAVVSVLKSELSKLKKNSKELEKKEEAKTVVKTESSETVAKEPVKPKEIKGQAKPVKNKEKKIVEGREVQARQLKRIETIPSSKQKPKVKEETLRSRVTITDEPVITLKPLPRKRKKAQPSKEESRQESSDFSVKEPLSFSTTATATQESVASEQPSAIDVPLTPGPEKTVVPVSSSSVAVAEEVEDGSHFQDLEVRVPVTVKDFSVKIGQKPSVILMRLMKIGFVAHINQFLDEEMVRRLGKMFGFNLVKVKTQEEQVIERHLEEEKDSKFLKTRAPVVTLMGHVDHGKTSLLDRIRQSRVADSEHGGITQHIGAYSVKTAKGGITFLDTPGHEAFTAMRARGAHITDIVILVVAADEGIMPQTLEAIDHAKAAGVPIVVALNKIDHRNANADRVKKQLSEIGLMPEDWGGKTVVVGVSALTGEGVDNLLEMILLEAELLELKANDVKKASGVVVEGHLSSGRGAAATVIVRSGILREGDLIIVGHICGKIKAMFDDKNRPLKEAGPATAVEILGLPEVPEAGENFYILTDERLAREICEKRQERLKDKRLAAIHKITLEELYSQIEKGVIKELNVILKADVQGSIEALKDSLGKIPSEKIKIKFIHSGLGDVNASDVLLASASNAIIIGFHVDIDTRAKEELERHPVDVRQYRIIYDAVNDMKNALVGLLEPKMRKKFVGRVEIRQVFKVSKAGLVAGSYVTKGKIHRKVQLEIIRNGEIIFQGKLASLKRFKDDVRDVAEGMECGLIFEGFDKFESGDIVEVYELESVAQKL